MSAPIFQSLRHWLFSASSILAILANHFEICCLTYARSFMAKGNHFSVRAISRKATTANPSSKTRSYRSNLSSARLYVRDFAYQQSLSKQKKCAAAVEFAGDSSTES
jgi:hypothetical protein